MNIHLVRKCLVLLSTPVQQACRVSCLGCHTPGWKVSVCPATFRLGWMVSVCPYMYLSTWHQAETWPLTQWPVWDRLTIVMLTDQWTLVPGHPSLSLSLTTWSCWVGLRHAAVPGVLEKANFLLLRPLSSTFFKMLVVLNCHLVIKILMMDF